MRSVVMDADIANGESLSPAISLRDGRLMGIQMPATWTTADLTFQGSYNGGTFADVYDESGTEVTISADASQFIIVDPGKWLGLAYLKVRSGTAASAVAQGGDRVIRLVLGE